MKTAKYISRKNFEKYDENHYLLYLNEASAEIQDKQNNVVEQGVQYSGNMEDGGTMIKASGVTPENHRDKFVAGLIGTRYDLDAQIAILANDTDTPDHAAELEAFKVFRQECKKAVDELLARTL